jgi:purine-binding chemotaxis protein CheW
MGQQTKKLNQYITFKLNQDWFGLAIDSVQEVKESNPCTPIPATPKQIKGLLNLRGQIVTVIDLRHYYAVYRPGHRDAPSKDLIIRANEELFALTIDSMGDIIEIDDSEIVETPPDLHSKWKKTCLGLYKYQKDMVILLDAEKIFHSQNIKLEQTA